MKKNVNIVTDIVCLKKLRPFHTTENDCCIKLLKMARNKAETFNKSR